jgi:tRNA pseudouridine38-40 synthase
MPRIAIGIEYDGAAFSGWQRQGHARSVQGELEVALARVADHPVELTAAGRTDAGVHALQQVAHFDSPSLRDERAWVLGTNSGAPADVGLLWARPVPDDFHARHSALARRYRYRILNQAVRPVLERQRACWIREPLDAERMHAAARVLVGEHDFSAFRAAECQSRVPVRRLQRIAVQRTGETIVVEVTANAFLHHMVRNLVGTLAEVGDGSRPLGWVGEVLAARDRRLSGPTAPPEGLYFLRVDYPVRFLLPSVPGAGAAGVSAIIPA